MTPEQLKTKRVFETYDIDGDDLISWLEWQGYIRQENDQYDPSLEENVNFWMNHRMEFNFIDFNRDEAVNKEEFEYWLNHPVNLTMQDTQNLVSTDNLILLSQDGPADLVNQSLI